MFDDLGTDPPVMRRSLERLHFANTKCYDAHEIPNTLKVTVGQPLTTGPIDVWLAEYDSLREEILFRMRMADQIALGSTTAIGVLLGVAFASSDQYLSVLLVLPLLNFLFTYAYLNQLRHVKVLGEYIRERLAPRLQALSGDPTAMGWELYQRSARNWALVPRLRMPHPAFMVLTSIIAMVMAYDDALKLSENRIVLAIDIHAIVFSIFLWVREELWRGSIPREAAQRTPEGPTNQNPLQPPNRH